MSNFQKLSCERSSGVRCKSVAETCNRLSRYLKERGDLDGFGLELSRKLEPQGSQTSHSTLESTNLHENKENPAERPAKHGLMELFPRHAGVSCPSIREDVTHNAVYSNLIVENEPAPMTIFYGGQLFVFDNFPGEKIKDLLQFAKDDSCFVPMPKPQVKTVGYDVPLMRTASFNRFMEKRKERAIARAPYKMHASPSASSTKHEKEPSLKL